MARLAHRAPPAMRQAMRLKNKGRFHTSEQATALRKPALRPARAPSSVRSRSPRDYLLAHRATHLRSGSGIEQPQA